MNLCQVVEKFDDLQQWAGMALKALESGDARRVSEYTRRCQECVSVLSIAMPLLVAEIEGRQSE
jgi:hypothetical protein